MTFDQWLLSLSEQANREVVENPQFRLLLQNAFTTGEMVGMRKAMERGQTTPTPSTQEQLRQAAARQQGI